MATKCAHCGAVAHTRSSRMLSPVSQEEYFQCTNIACGHTFTAIREHRETLSPSATPNPQVRLPQASRAKLAAIRMAERLGEDRDQIPLELDS
ncbi:ogr/Delta-like zinc finger family protein [Chromobacterium alkanivorans]|uniref:ogr/Delta-like zinc finger family protein n=1 Tax=Chromobacterium alkanivorans TaxID=1071719 RepID=UPI001967AF65|nr:ogr/Delta-like zinc finger family protein [Chromobacterium alkanivorans]MBN3005603.1 ogr/Delta-like zinc finger family protein [Chromobacterium alkanivorans]